MISAFILTAMISIEEPRAIIQDPIKVEARRRGKGQKGRRKGGNGLR